MLFVLLGCVEPGLLSGITDHLSTKVVASADPSLRLGVELASLTVELCPLKDSADLNSATFSGWGADGLNPTDLRATKGETGAGTFTFTHLGTADNPGTVNIVGNPEWNSFSFTWHGDDKSSYIGGYALNGCDGAVLATGGGTYTSADGTTGIVALIGDENGMRFNSDAAAVPSSGQARWQSADKKESVTLDPADSVDLAAGTWPAEIVGSGWSTEILVQFP